MKPLSIVATLSALALSLAAGCKSTSDTEATAGSASHIEQDCQGDRSTCDNNCVDTGGDGECYRKCTNRYDLCTGAASDGTENTTRGNGVDCDAQYNERATYCETLSDDDRTECLQNASHNYSACNRASGNAE